MPHRDITTVSDTDLVERTRRGDVAAYGELWSRHARAARAAAVSFSSTLDPDDVVSEAFTKVLKAIQAGGGPKTAFRAYLFTTVRNTAAGIARSRREFAMENADLIEDPRFSDENVLAALDHTLTAKAFKSLPERWQEALWYSEIEQMTPQEMAPILGMKANSVAALTYRARDGLRQAWIQAHVSTVEVGSQHQWTLDHLGAYTRKKLVPRDVERLEDHLADCMRCRIVAEEMSEVGSRLALVLLPLLLGVSGALGYNAWLDSSARAVAATMSSTPAPHGLVAAAGSLKNLTIRKRLTLGTAGTVALTVVVVTASSFAAARDHRPDVSSIAASVATPAAISPKLPTTHSAPSPHAPAARAVNVPPAVHPGLAPVRPTAPKVTSARTVSPKASAVPPKTTEPVPVSSTKPPVITIDAPPAPDITAPTSFTFSTTPAPIHLAGTGVPGAKVSIQIASSVSSADDARRSSAASSPATIRPSNVLTTVVGANGEWEADIDASAWTTGDYEVTVNQTVAGRTSPDVSRILRILPVVSAPAITRVDDGSLGNLSPIVTGTGTPGATITLTTNTGVTTTVLVGANGAWATPELTQQAPGAGSVTATQALPGQEASGPSSAVDFVLSPPPTLSWSPSDGVVGVSIQGIPGASVQIASATMNAVCPTVLLDASGSGGSVCGVAGYWWPTQSRYIEGTRTGPWSASTTGR